MFDIAQESARHTELKRRLLAEHGELDEETLADTLEGLTELNEVIAAALRSALDDESLITALKDRIASMRERSERLASRAKAKRRACAEAMAGCGLQRIDQPDLTVTLRKRSERVEIDSTDLIPASYWRTPAPVLEKRALSDALKAGEAIAGARLVEGESSITVRVK